MGVGPRGRVRQLAARGGAPAGGRRRRHHLRRPVPRRRPADARPPRRSGHQRYIYWPFLTSRRGPAPFGLRFWSFLLEGVDVVVADMLDLPFEQESFDLVIEKGTMVWNVHELLPFCVLQVILAQLCKY